MTTKRYNKLVRDRIPEIIESKGGRLHFRTLNKKEFLKAAKKKVLEEAKELVAARSKKAIIYEIVDIHELLDILTAELGVTKFELYALRRKKNQEKGGFEKKFFLIKAEARPRA